MQSRGHHWVRRNSVALVLFWSIAVPGIHSPLLGSSETVRIPLGEGTRSYDFEMEVISDEDGRKEESRRNGKPFIEVRQGEEYSIRLTNPLPVRVGVNLVVDGLNTITGKPVSSPSDGKYWILDPQSSETIRGWQVSSSRARRFRFVSREKSYARWKGSRWGRELDVNCGVIGAAFFWSSSELERALEPRRKRISREGAPASAPESRTQDWSMGTGQGGSTGSSVTTVKFRADAGMFDPDETLVILYDEEGPGRVPRRRPPPPRPLPVEEDDDEGDPREPQAWGRRKRGDYVEEMPPE